MGAKDKKKWLMAGLLCLLMWLLCGCVGNNKMSIDLLYRLIDALDTDANTILGIKENDENSVDKRLKELNPKLKETLTELFLKTIDGVEK